MGKTIYCIIIMIIIIQSWLFARRTKKYEHDDTLHGNNPHGHIRGIL